MGSALTVALLCCALAGTAGAQDALRGKRLYLDGGRGNGAGISCVDCHGGMPGALHGIARAGGRPAAIEYALGAIPQMAPLRGRLSGRDIEDLSAYLANPGVPSPRLSLAADGPAASPHSPERLEFRAAAGSNSPVTVVRLRNTGERPLRLLSAPAIAGRHAQQFAIVSSDCSQGSVLEPQSSCGIGVAFWSPSGGTLFTATLGVDHDWVGGAVAVALLGYAGQIRAR